MARTFSRGRGPRRKTQWAGFGDLAGAANLPVPLALTAGTPVILSFNMVLTGAVGLVDEEVTITRMIGQMLAFLRTDTASAMASVAVGCAIVRNETITAGVASLPSPEDDPDFEWLYYAVVPLLNPLSITGASVPRGSRVSFDVRGQRIVRAGQTPVWLAESQGEAAFCGVGGRYLSKLT